MARTYTIVVSTMDAASVNIRDNLFRLATWVKVADSPYIIYRSEGFELVEISDYHVFQDGLDIRLDAIGHRPEAIIFASKHRSKDERKTLTVHHTGNIGENKFGGRPFELATPAPHIAASLLIAMKNSVTAYGVSYEATHHGPSDLATPSVYVEIGSTMEEWKDSAAGAIVAKAILGIKEDLDMPCFVGIGGNHYAPRETALTLETGVAFGHILPDHAIAEVTEDILRQAFEKTGTKYAYLDKKSIPREQRERIEALIAKFGYEVTPESEIRELSMPWLKCQRIADIAKDKDFQPRPQFTKSLQDALAHCDPGACGSCPMGITESVDDTLLSMAWNVNKEKLQNIFSEQQIAYFYWSNGCPAGILIGTDRAAVTAAARVIVEGSVDILRSKYEVKYDHWEENLYVIDRRFDPEKAKQLGVTEGPLYGRLARGEAVTANGMTITPQMVYSETVKRIKLNNYSSNIRDRDGVMEQKEPSIFSPVYRTAKEIDDHGEIIDSEERQNAIIDGEKAAAQPDKVGDTDDDIMKVMESLKTNVLVLGCGGGGSNSITRMALEGITGAKLFALNTDAQHLLHTKADKKFLIGKKLTRGFGAGSLPEVGENAAKESLNEIKAAMANSDMVFVTCGLGGGTGTGSAPVVAQTAKEGGALTIAVVTTPFKVEGAVRRANAEKGLARLREAADTVIVVPNDRLLEVVPNLPMQAAFMVADEVLAHAVKGITELVTKSGLVNLDFADIRTIMSNGGVAMIGLGEGKGEDGALKSVANALESPLLDIDITGAKAAIVNVTGGEHMTISEAESVVEEVYNAIDADARLIWGASVDPELGDMVRTMVIITGVKSNQIMGKAAPEPVPVAATQQKTLKSQKFGIDFVG